MSTFIAIDPSSSVLGWAIFQEKKIGQYGTLSLEHLDLAYRFPYLVEYLTEVLSRYPVQTVVIEKAVRFRGHSIPALEVACLVLEQWARKAKLKYFGYNPAQWKALVLGSAQASKAETALIIGKLYPVLPPQLSEHIYDAVGIGYFHYLFTSKPQL